MPLDLTKPLRTKHDHYPVVLLSNTNGYLNWAEDHNPDKKMSDLRWLLNGGVAAMAGNWLENIPETKTVWINFDEDGSSLCLDSRDEADRWANGDREACVKLTYTIGEGLST